MQDIERTIAHAINNGVLGAMAASHMGVRPRTSCLHAGALESTDNLKKGESSAPSSTVSPIDEQL
jgi:hypothetical protein